MIKVTNSVYDLIPGVIAITSKYKITYKRLILSFTLMNQPRFGIEVIQDLTRRSLDSLYDRDTCTDMYSELVHYFSAKGYTVPEGKNKNIIMFSF